MLTIFAFRFSLAVCRGMGKKKSHTGKHLARLNVERAWRATADDDEEGEAEEHERDGVYEVEDDQEEEEHEVDEMEVDKGGGAPIGPETAKRRRRERDHKAQQRRRQQPSAEPGILSMLRRASAPVPVPAPVPAAASPVPAVSAHMPDPAPTPAAPAEECSICLMPMDAAATGNRAVATLSCGHEFHAACILQHARIDAASHASCPLCRAADPTGSSTPAAAAPKEQLTTATAATAATSATTTSATTTTTDATITPATTPGYSASGKKLGRPKKEQGGSSSSSSATYASHRGVGPKSLGSNTRESKATRSEMRRTASTAAAAAIAAAATADNGGGGGKRQRSDAGKARGPQLLRDFPSEMGDRLLYLTSRSPSEKRLDRWDVVGGEDLSHVEWMQVRKHPWELRRVDAMAHWYSLRQVEGLSVGAAAKSAARAVILGNKAKPLTGRYVLQWLGDYVKEGGRIKPSHRGQHVSTESFLTDQKLKQRATEWLRENVQAARKKPKSGEHPTPPLNVSRFCMWINGTLLKEILAEPRTKRKPIDERTACRWLHALGFGYCSHKKNIYFDGHERQDVVDDRMEKMVMLKVLEEVTVRFGGDNCEIVIWPADLRANEPPLVLISQDECAFHGNDDVPYEWCEEGKMSLKQKSRGAFLMISEFLSEHAGRLRCSKAEADAYAAARPQSLIAKKLAEGKVDYAGGVEARLTLEPGAAKGKDNYFDNEQLIAQTQLAMEVFDAMGRHVAPAREVVRDCVTTIDIDANGEATVRLEPVVEHLPAVRCQGLFLFDHSSGHDAGASDGLNITTMTKGPDWKANQMPMRNGYYLNSRGAKYPRQAPRVAQSMQFAEGDVLLCDVTVPVGIDASAHAAPAATAPLRVQPEQLIGRSVLYEHEGLQYSGSVTGIDDKEDVFNLIVDFNDNDMSVWWWRFAVSEVLECLVGPPPDPEQHQEASATREEETSACELWFKKSRKQALKRTMPDADAATLRATATAEWPKLSEERRLLWVRKVRAVAASGGAAPTAADRLLRCGECVPRVLWGRNKGMEAVLAERKLLPPGGLRAACPTDAAHTADNRCCCKRLLGSQPDFRTEQTGLERVVSRGSSGECVSATATEPPKGHRCLFLPKYHCELNWIERYWGAAKKYARRHCGYTLSALRVCVPIALSQTRDELPEELRTSADLPVSPLFKQRRWARISRQFMIEYRKGESGDAVVRAVAAQRSQRGQKRHRDTNDARSRQVEARMEEVAFSCVF